MWRVELLLLYPPPPPSTQIITNTIILGGNVPINISGGPWWFKFNITIGVGWRRRFWQIQWCSYPTTKPKNHHLYLLLYPQTFLVRTQKYPPWHYINLLTWLCHTITSCKWWPCGRFWPWTMVPNCWFKVVIWLVILWPPHFVFVYQQQIDI